jgi:hypothetical protein
MAEQIYFLAALGEGGAVAAVKIGLSHDPASRLRHLQTASAARLHLLGTMTGSGRVERQLHRAWHRARLGGEWFRPDPDLLAYVKRVCRAGAFRRYRMPQDEPGGGIME